MCVFNTAVSPLFSALIHEEYAQRLQWLGFDTQVLPIRLDSRWQDISRPRHWWQSPVDWSAVEATEDLKDIPATGAQPHASSSLPLFPQKGHRLLTLTVSPLVFRLTACRLNEVSLDALSLLSDLFYTISFCLTHLFHRLSYFDVKVRYP